MLNDHNAIVAIPGWGFNSSLLDLFNQDPLHLVGWDYYSNNFDQSLEEITRNLAHQLQDHSMILGWSFGGLIAINLCALFPKKVHQLILISTQPKFLADHDWQGIHPDQAKDFIKNLSCRPLEPVSYTHLTLPTMFEV